MKKLLHLTILILLSYAGWGQNTGDYRTNGSGTWTTLGIWQTYNGSSWVAATQIPGTTYGNYSVSISLGNTVSGGSGTSSFENLIVYGQLNIVSSWTLSNTDRLIIDGGKVLWTTNSPLTLSPTNSTVSVFGFDPLIQNGLQGTPCNNNKALYLGTVRYAVCTGGGNADYIFDDINNAGGSITAVPSATPENHCLGNSFILAGDYSGLISTPPTYTWSGTGPGGYSFSSNDQNPGTITLPMEGIYVYSLTVSTTINGNTYFNTQSVTVTVSGISVAGTAGSDQSICQNTQPSDLTLTGNTGPVQWQWSTDNINFTDIAGQTSTTLAGSAIGNLTSTTYFRASVSNGTCPPVLSNTVTVTVELPEITGNTTVMVGNTLTLTGNYVPHPTTPWISSAPSIATVSSGGVVTGISVGNVDITYMTSMGCTTVISIEVIPSVCYEDPSSPGVGGISSEFGISTLNRNTNLIGTVWPQEIKGAYMVLESKSKGFVITRVTSTTQIQSPVAGMIVYDGSLDCLSIYNGTEWKCYNVPTCP